MTNIYEPNELAGQIEGLGRMLLILVASLEDVGFLDGPAYTAGMRRSIVLNEQSDIVMTTAHQTLLRIAGSLDDARRWREFRRQALAPIDLAKGGRRGKVA